MKRVFSLLLIAVFMASMINAEGNEKYGKEISLEKKTKISDIVDNPTKFEGEKVLIKGKVEDVCENRGCWIEVADSYNHTIKVKVEDGEIVFPAEAEGKTALVEGTVYGVDLNSADCSSHKKEKESEMATPSCCTGKKSASKVYQIKGIGAVLK
jgi:hypothetical protein